MHRKCYLLVEHCPVAAEEAVLGSAGHNAVVVLDRQADVEDLGEEGSGLQILIFGASSIWRHIKTSVP